MSLWIEYKWIFAVLYHLILKYKIHIGNHCSLPETPPRVHYFVGNYHNNMSPTHVPKTSKFITNKPAPKFRAVMHKFT